MDPLSATASVIAVIQMSEKVGSAAYRYVKGAKNAKSDIESLLDEIGGLKTFLENTQTLLESPQGSKLETSQDLNARLKKLLCELRRINQDLEEKLAAKKNKILPAAFLKWPFESSKIQEIVQKLAKFRGDIEACLQIDQTYVRSYCPATD